MKQKLIGTAYVNILKEENGEVKFAYGYEMKEEELSLNDLAVPTIQLQDKNRWLELIQRGYNGR